MIEGIIGLAQQAPRLIFMRAFAQYFDGKPSGLNPSSVIRSSPDFGELRKSITASIQEDFTAAREYVKVGASTLTKRRLEGVACSLTALIACWCCDAASSTLAVATWVLRCVGLHHVLHILAHESALTVHPWETSRKCMCYPRCLYEHKLHASLALDVVCVSTPAVACSFSRRTAWCTTLAVPGASMYTRANPRACVRSAATCTASASGAMSWTE